jgi:hypothetical protein
MSRKLLFPLSLLGALIGGFPGGVLAWAAAGGTGSEVVVCIANVLLGVAGACMGMCVATAIRGDGKTRVADVVVPLILGLLCGVLG